MKHASGTGSETSIMKRSLLSSFETQLIASDFDKNAISALHPLENTSIINPFVNGPHIFKPGEETFQLSYKANEAGINYTWIVKGINGTNYSYTEGGSPNFVPYLEVGTYEIKCTVSGGKYISSSTATKTVTVEPY